MDEATCDLLKKWKLSNYIERFEAERIDIATMQLLSNEDIKKMFPKIGDRARFEAMLRSDQPKDIMNNTFSFSLFDEVLGGEISGSLINIDPTPPFKEPDSNQGSLVDNILIIPLDSSETRNNIVSTILNSSDEGRQIITIGQKTGALPLEVRTRLCKLLMEKLITADNPVLQTDSQLLSLSYDIGRLFHGESPPLYYAPYLPADAYQSKRNTSPCNLLLFGAANQVPPLQFVTVQVHKPN